MKQGMFEVISNEPLTSNVYRMELCGDTSAIVNADTFVNIALPNLFLRRPISVCDVREDTLTIIYKVVGKGTDALSNTTVGEMLDVLTGLGNGYDISSAGDAPLLIGGGVGVPPMYLLARKLREQGKDVNVILGFNTKEEIFYEEEFKDLGCHTYVTTVDGSYGIKGFVTDAANQLTKITHTYSCGPLPMLKAVYRSIEADGDFSFEERMGCGFGACMGCSIQTKNGNKRVCKEGPVFKKEDILWED